MRLKMSDIIDVSISLKTGMVCWPGSVGFKLYKTMDMSKGDIANNSCIDTDVHIGTHIDAPRHSIPKGKTVDKLPLYILLGKSFVAYLPDVNEITSKTLANHPIPKDTKRLIFHTRNSKMWKKKNNRFNKNYVSLTKDGAEWIVNHGIRLVGIDYLSIQKFGESMETHNILLKNDVVIIEGLNMSKVKEGFYELICLPLKIIGAEGSPARVVLREI